MLLQYRRNAESAPQIQKVTSVNHGLRKAAASVVPVATTANEFNPVAMMSAASLIPARDGLRVNY